MNAFLSKHKRRIAGTLSCVDRIVFKGYLPISWADAFESLLSRNQCLIKDFHPFVQKLSAQVKTAAQQAAEETGRPYIYLNHQQRKEEFVKKIAQEDINRIAFLNRETPAKTQRLVPEGALR